MLVPFFSNIIGFKPIIVEWNGTHMTWLLLCYYFKKKKFGTILRTNFLLKEFLQKKKNMLKAWFVWCILGTLSFCGYFMLVFLYFYVDDCLAQT